MTQEDNKRGMFHRLRGKLIKTAVTPKLLGDIPDIQQSLAQHSEQDVPVFYVLQERSRSNSVLVDNEARRLGLPPALIKVKTESIDEKAAVIFIKHSVSNKHAHSPRLFRLLQAVKNKQTDVLLVPVTILWGREPGKEDSIFRLLMADSWAETTLTKQLLNIGIHGRDTYLQFHPAISLQALLAKTSQDTPGVPPVTAIEVHVGNYLNAQREMVVGPDLSDRRNEVEKIISSPAIKHAILKEADATNQLPKKVQEVARGYMEEIVTDYSQSVIRAFERVLNWLWNQLYDGVKVYHFDGLRELAEKHEIIYLPSHRSHIDYLLIMYVLYSRGLRTPFVAAGDNLNVPVVGPILRRGGAFFLRRSFGGNALYTAVFREYVHNIISRNIPLKFFLEGGRSRSGRLLPAKTGLLAMTVHSQLRGAGKPIAYVPTYIGYERLLEGSAYVGEMKGKPKEAESVFSVIKAMRKIERIFGHVHVSFGEPILLQDILDKNGVKNASYSPNRNDEPLGDSAVEAVHDLSIKVMKNINKAAVINPVSLLSLVLLSTPKHSLDEVSCVEQLDLYKQIASQVPYDEHTVLTELNGKDIIRYGLKLKLINRIKHVMGDMISIEADQSVLLTYFRNNILHAFIIPSMVAALVGHNGRMLKDDIFSIINLLYPFLQTELFLKWRHNKSNNEVDGAIERIIEAMINTGLLQDDGRGMLYAYDVNGVTSQKLDVLAAPVQLSLKRYFMALALISQQGSGQMSSKEIVNLCYLLGQRLSLLYEFDSPEFFDRALFTSFITALKRMQYLSEDDDGKLTFDGRIDQMAQNARFVLDAETLSTLENMAALSADEIHAAIESLGTKKHSRFKRKKS